MKMRFTPILACALLSSCATVKEAFQEKWSGIPSEGTLIETVDSGTYAPGVMAIGHEKDLANQRASGSGLIPAPALTAYLNGVLDRLKESSPIEGIPGQVYVQYDAFPANSTADGNIFVDLELLLELESEDEVAAVLAHELAHLVLKHHTADVVMETQRRLMNVHRVGRRLAEQLAGVLGKDPDSIPGADVLKYQRYAYHASSRVVTPLWSRKQELQADVLGADLLHKAGYNRSAATEVLERLAAIEARQKQQREQSERRNDVPSPPEDLHGLVELARNQLEGALDDVIDSLERDHPPAEDRLEDLKRYLTRKAYRRAARQAVTSKPWRRLLASAEVRALRIGYEEAEKAMAALTDGQVRKAVRHARRAVSGRTSRHAYPRYVFHRVRSRQGRHDLAIKNLEIAMRGPEPSAIIYTALAKERLRAGAPAAAADLLRHGYYEVFERHHFLVPPLLQAYHAMGRNLDAHALMVECQVEHGGLDGACESEDAART